MWRDLHASRTGPVLPSGEPGRLPVFSDVCIVQLLVFCVVFWKPLFFCWSFFLWPLHCQLSGGFFFMNFTRPNNLSLVSLYISFLLFGHFFFLPHRKHYYIKVVESIQFLCTGNSGISRDLCNANTYRSIHEGLFFNSSPALDLKYPLRLPSNHLYLSSLHLHFTSNDLHS
jgi:hypothetical protein